jgi:signal transduction histidine kinase
MSARRGRLPWLTPTRLDAVLAVAIAIEVGLERWFVPGVADSRRALAVVTAVALAAPVAVRRRWPAGALVACAAVPAIQSLVGGDLDHNSGLGVMLALIVLAYSTAAWVPLRRAAWAPVVAAVVFSGFVVGSAPSVSAGVGDELFFVALVFVAPWFVGRLMRERSRRAAAFRELAAQADAERAQRELSAIAQERVRIGRELQDIIAHSVSAMVIQASGARSLLASEPERARDSILVVEQTGREALADLRRLLGVLRKDEDPRALAPQPGLDQVETLLESIRESGLRCELSEDGEPADLTPGVDLVGYRVVEATLACAARHGTRHAAVTVRYQPGGLELDIRGDGSRPDVDLELHGMAQRVALYGGNLRALPVADGFALRARLPLASVVA